MKKLFKLKIIKKVNLIGNIYGKHAMEFPEGTYLQVLNSEYNHGDIIQRTGDDDHPFMTVCITRKINPKEPHTPKGGLWGNNISGYIFRELSTKEAHEIINKYNNEIIMQTLDVRP